MNKCNKQLLVSSILAAGLLAGCGGSSAAADAKPAAGGAVIGGGTPAQAIAFEWKSSEALIKPPADRADIFGVKDPTIVHHDGRYHIFMTTAGTNGSVSSEVVQLANRGRPRSAETRQTRPQ